MYSAVSRLQCSALGLHTLIACVSKTVCLLGGTCTWEFLKLTAAKSISRSLGADEQAYKAGKMGARPSFQCPIVVC
jgi:hypothetical protein